MKLRSIFFLLILAAITAPRARAQSQTLVSATVTDPNGVPYAGAKVTASLQPAGTASPCVVVSGNCVPIPGTVGPATLDATGTFSMNVYPNSSILCGGQSCVTTWQFSVVISPGVLPPWGTGPQSFSINETVSGATQSLSAAMDAVAPDLTIAFSNGQGIPTVTNVANYGTFANTQVSPNVGVFNNGTQYIAYAPLSANLFSQADVGKTMWVTDASQGNTALPQGTIVSVTVSGSNQVITTTTLTGQSQCNPMGGCVAVWGNDDTPAFTAAATAANTIGGTLYIPCGTYMLTAPALDENGITGFSIQGQNLNCVTLIPSPQITPNGNDAIAVNFTSISGKWVTGFQVNGEGGLFPSTNPIIQFNQGRSLSVSDIQLIDAATNGTEQFAVIGIDHSTFTNITSRDPAQVGGAGLGSGDMCYFNSSANLTVVSILCSNSVGQNSANLRVVNFEPEDLGDGIQFVGGIIDECGESTTGEDGALSACAIITNSVHVSFSGTILWSSNNGGSPGLSVDGTSEVNLDNGVSVGPFGTECGDGITIASGGILRMEHTNVRSFESGSCGTYGINNGGTLYYEGGNNITSTGGSSQLTGNVPIFGTTQIGSVTPGHLAVWGSGLFGQLADGGAVPSSNVAIQSTARTTLASDISLSANTATTVVTDTVTMPSSGCPCRVLAQYTIYLATNNWTGTSWLTDGTNIFASGQTTGVGTNVTAISASEVSQTTYANSATPTFTLTFQDNGSGGDVKAAAAQGSATNTYLTLTVLTSN